MSCFAVIEEDDKTRQSTTKSIKVESDGLLETAGGERTSLTE
jgi:hypothetical protein